MCTMAKKSKSSGTGAAANPKQAKKAKMSSPDEKEEEDLSHLDMSTRDKRIELFNYGHLRGMPPSYPKKIIDAIEEAHPLSKSRIDAKHTKERDVCFETAVLSEENSTVALRIYNKYRKLRDTQVNNLPDGEKQEYSSGVKCVDIKSAPSYERQTLTCKDCIVAYRNEEEKTGYCWGCSKMVCSLCSMMCIACNSSWCEPCAKGHGDYDEGCCGRMHFSQLDYARRYLDSDEYDSDYMESTWWGNEECKWSLND